MTYHVINRPHVPMHARASLASDHGWSGMAIDPPAADPVPPARPAGQATVRSDWHAFLEFAARIAKGVEAIRRALGFR